jgi:glycosyltransferase involved in cell wall biosynthesis
MIIMPRFIRLIKPKVSLVFFGLPSGPIGWWIKKVYGIPYILSLQGGDVPGFMGNDLHFFHWITQPLTRMVWNAASFVVANSHGLAKTARENVPNIKIAVISAGADLESFYPKVKLRKAGPIKLLFVGRLVKQKGLDILLTALAEMGQKQAWVLDLVGEGPLQGQLLKTARKYKIKDRITFHGWVQKSNLPEFYRTSDLFILPSRDEGMPNAMLEAMASGLPVIGSRVSGIEEVVVDGKTGFLVPPEDPLALKNIIENILYKPERIQIMSKNCREKIEDQYSWEVAASSYIKLIECSFDSQTQ